jgi:hypothetical protein
MVPVTWIWEVLFHISSRIPTVLTQGVHCCPQFKQAKFFLSNPPQFTNMNSFYSVTLTCWGHVVVQLVEALG